MQTTPALQVASTNQPPSLDNNDSLRDGNREKEPRGGIVGSDSESLFPPMVLLIFQEAKLLYLFFPLLPTITSCNVVVQENEKIIHKMQGRDIIVYHSADLDKLLDDEDSDERPCDDILTHN